MAGGALGGGGEPASMPRPLCPSLVKSSISENESSSILSTKNLTAAPATNAFPAPSRTIVLTSDREFRSSLTSPSCPTTVTFSAFIASGLLIRTVAMPSSSTSTST